MQSGETIRSQERLISLKALFFKRGTTLLSLWFCFFNEFITLWGVCLCQNVTFCLFCLSRAPQLGLHLLFWPFVSRGQTSKRNCCFARFLETFVLFRCEESFFFRLFQKFCSRGKEESRLEGNIEWKLKSIRLWTFESIWEVAVWRKPWDPKSEKVLWYSGNKRIVS